MRFANRRHGEAASRRGPAPQRSAKTPSRCRAGRAIRSHGVQFLWRGTRRPDVRSLRRVVANTSGHVSPAMLAGIQNPCPLRRVRTPPDRANCRALECSAIRSGRPAAWLRRPERLRRATPCTMTISLAFLAPSLVKAAVDGRLPRGIGVARLFDAPVAWSRQHQMLGLAH
jgi:hypothetical protein